MTMPCACCRDYPCLYLHEAPCPDFDHSGPTYARVAGGCKLGWTGLHLGKCRKPRWLLGLRFFKKKFVTRQFWVVGRVGPDQGFRLVRTLYERPAGPPGQRKLPRRAGPPGQRRELASPRGQPASPASGTTPAGQPSRPAELPPATGRPRPAGLPRPAASGQRSPLASGAHTRTAGLGPPTPAGLREDRVFPAGVPPAGSGREGAAARSGAGGRPHAPARRGAGRPGGGPRETQPWSCRGRRPAPGGAGDHGGPAQPRGPARSSVVQREAPWSSAQPRGPAAGRGPAGRARTAGRSSQVATVQRRRDDSRTGAWATQLLALRPPARANPAPAPRPPGGPGGGRTTARCSSRCRR